MNATADANATEVPEWSNPSQPTRDWGAPSGKGLRPGIGLGMGCTANFLFHENGTRFFLGTAAHCVTTYPEAEGRFCKATAWDEIGSEVTLNGRDGTSATAKLAYNSAMAMTQLGETDLATCDNNDLALVEIDASQFDDLHPAVSYFGGPVALDDHNLTVGQDIYFFGNSPYRTQSELLDPQAGTFYGYLFDGWDFDWAFGPEAANPMWGDPGDAKATTFPIPGDSGGPFLGPTGNALAMLGGGANNLRLAMEWMDAHWSWSVGLVTWHEFSPDGIEPARPV